MLTFKVFLCVVILIQKLKYSWVNKLQSYFLNNIIKPLISKINIISTNCTVLNILKAFSEQRLRYINYSILGGCTFYDLGCKVDDPLPSLYVRLHLRYFFILLYISPSLLRAIPRKVSLDVVMEYENAINNSITRWSDLSANTSCQ